MASPHGQVEPAPLDPNARGGPAPSRRSKARRLAFAALGVAIVAVLLTGVGFFLWMLIASNTGIERSISLSEPVEGVLGPESTIGAAGKPFVDYEIVIEQGGTYQIDLVSHDPDYNPFLSVLRNNDIVDNDDDSGEGSDARVVKTLTPGTYTLRVTRYDTGIFEQPVGFTLVVDRTDTMARR